MIQIPFAQSHFSIDIPTKDIQSLELRPAEPSTEAVLALKDHEELSRYRGRDTLCIVNDATRPTRTQEIIEKCGLECNFMVATGAHVAPTSEELRNIFGPRFGRNRIFIHDARRSPCVYVGTTSRGTPVAFNSKLFDYKRILIIGSVAPHYFAGYTGGRKGLLPGVAAYETIEKNHALYFAPGADILRLNGNPVHEDMLEAVRMLDFPILNINMVMDSTNQIMEVFCGELETCLSEAVELARTYYTVPVPRKVEMVVTCAHYPMDVDLYQSQKAIYNAARVARMGGKIVLVSQCRNGIGPRTYYELMSKHETPRDILLYTKDHYSLGYHKAASLAKALQDFQLFVLSDLPKDILHRIHLRECTPDELQKELATTLSKGETVAFMPQGSITVPILVSHNEATSGYSNSQKSLEV